MTVLTRMRRGCHLGYRSLRIVFRDKTLLLFPLIPFSIAAAIAFLFSVIIGPDELNWALLSVNLMHHFRYVVMLYALAAVVSVFFEVGLVACARITIDERDSKFVDGLQVAFKKLHWVILWAFISWTIGPVLGLLDQLRHTANLVQKIAKTNWSQLRFFLLPILVIDNVNVFSAIRRSIRTTTKTWGKGTVAQFGLMWFFLLLNVPTIVLIALGHYREGPWPSPLTLVVICMVYFTFITYQTASTVLSVVLYKYASDGSVVKGFDAAWMKEAFARPKVYVLVDDAPEDRNVPVEDVPAPEGVEPAGEVQEPSEGDYVDELDRRVCIPPGATTLAIPKSTAVTIQRTGTGSWRDSGRSQYGNRSRRDGDVERGRGGEVDLRRRRARDSGGRTRPVQTPHQVFAGQERGYWHTCGTARVGLVGR